MEALKFTMINNKKKNAAAEYSKLNAYFSASKLTDKPKNKSQEIDIL